MIPCIAYLDSGAICCSEATVLDPQRGGMVCAAHAPEPDLPPLTESEALRDRLAAALKTDVAPLILPEEITPAIREVLGYPNFFCAPYAHLFRKAGAEIAEKSEDEQAYVLWWLLRLVLKHGDNWRAVAQADLNEARDRIGASGEAEL